MTEVEILDRMMEKVRAEIGELRAHLQLEERYLEDLVQRRQVAAARAPDHSAPDASAVGSDPPRATARVHSDSVVSQVLTILEAAGHEMDLVDIARKLEKRGLRARRKGGMRDTAYSAVIRRRDLFVCLRPGVYDLKSRHPAIPVERNGRRGST